MNIHERKFDPIPIEEIDAAKTGTESVDAASLPVPTIPPDDAPSPDWMRLFGRAPVAHWAYRSENGKPLYFICRIDRGERDGKTIKDFLPACWFEGKGWASKHWPSPRPLYNLHNIIANPSAPIVVVEGEKAADAAARIFPRSIVTTSSGGSKGASKTDWNPFRGRTVMLCPDDDAPGRQYAQEVAASALKLGCSVSIVDTAALREKVANDVPADNGWDIADAVIACSDIAALRKAIASVTKPVDPPKAYVSVFPFTMSERGLFKRVRAKGDDGDDGEGEGDDTALEKQVVRTVRIAPSFEILGKCRDPNGKSQGLLLRWRDDGRMSEMFIPYSALYGDAAALCGALADAGLRVDERRVRDFKRYLNSVEIDARVTRVTRTGWHEICGKNVFVLRDVTIGNDISGVVMLDGADKAPYEAKGTVDSWRNNIAKPAGDHLLLRLAISTALAGPLLYLADAEGGGVNFHGSSSKGKTTLLRVAASVWGNGNSIKTWSATGNSFEASAVVTTDTLLAIDEIGMAGTREVFSALYTLANGQGKSRLNRDASMRATRAWRVMVASTGEVPVETKIAEDNGRKARAGQLVRMIDVPATERAFGAFDSAPDGDSRAVADKFKLAASTHYGTAGPEFVRRIIADGVDGDAIRELINEFAKANVPPGSDGQIERVAGRFGIIAAAGEMATEFGLTGWGKGAATDAASWAFSQWIEAQGGGAIEERQAIAQVRQIIEQYGDSRFQSLDDCDARPVNDRLGWRQNTTDGPEWYATPENFKTQICAGLNPQKVAKILSERGMLHKQKGQGYQCTRTVFGKDLKVYVLKSILEEGKSEP